MSESYPATSALPDLVVAADWSTVETKRWMVRGERVGDGYVVYPPEPVGDHKSLMARLRRALPDDHRLLIGFDFPIGLPVEYAQKASVASFRTFLGEMVGRGEWERFYQISDLPSLRQPFFPLPKQQSGNFRAQLALALGFPDLVGSSATLRAKDNNAEGRGVPVLHSRWCSGRRWCHRRMARCDPACACRSQAMALRW